MGIQKAWQARCNPVHRKAYGRAQGQHLGAAVAEYLLSARRQPIKGVLHLGQIGGAHLGQHKAARAAFEQGFVQVVF